MSSRRKNLTTSQYEDSTARIIADSPVEAWVRGQGQRCQACAVASHISYLFPERPPMAANMATQRVTLPRPSKRGP